MDDKQVKRNFKIKATVFSMENGFVSYENIKSIKITSDKYNILIMEDYLPVIGDVDGKVDITFEDKVLTLDNIVAYYKHSHNNFELLIKEFKKDV